MTSSEGRATGARGLRCKECGEELPLGASYACEFCFGPLEVVYDRNALARDVTRESIEAGPPSIWRYADLLPGRQVVQGGNEDGPPEELSSESRLEFLGRRIIDVEADDPFGPRLGLSQALSAVFKPFRHQSSASTRHKVPASPFIG